MAAASGFMEGAPREGHIEAVAWHSHRSGAWGGTGAWPSGGDAEAHADSSSYLACLQANGWAVTNAPRAIAFGQVASDGVGNGWPDAATMSFLARAGS